LAPIKYDVFRLHAQHSYKLILVYWANKDKSSLFSILDNDSKNYLCIYFILVVIPSQGFRLSCGSNHSLAINHAGELYSWGQGRDGALGLGDKIDKELPTLVQALKDIPIKQVACGNGFSIILTESGEVFSCGISDYGQTGLGSTAELSVRLPTKIRSLRDKKVAQVSAGDYHSACITEDGELYIWGLGSDGQIGNGTTKLHNITPCLVESLKGKKIMQVACGGSHTGAIDEHGQLYMWGKGRDGQLGRGDQLESVAAYRAEPVLVPYFRDNQIKVKEVALGKDFSVSLS